MAKISNFDIKWSDKAVRKMFDELEEKEIPEMMSQTLNHLAVGARKSLQTEMRSLFNNPVPWTLNMFSVKRAKKNDLTAWVGDKEWAGKGRAAKDYLMPMIEGTTRSKKGSEILMNAISEGQYWVPGPDAGQIENENGKIKKGEIVKILSRLKLFNAAGYKANFNPLSDKSIRMRQQRKNAAGKESEYFVGHHKDKTPMGIFKYVKRPKGFKGDRVLFLIKFVKKKPLYKKKFPMPDLIDKYVADNFSRVAGVEFSKLRNRMRK